MRKPIVFVGLVLSLCAVARTVDSSAPTKTASLMAGILFVDTDISKAYACFDMPSLELAENEIVTSATLWVNVISLTGSINATAHTFAENGWVWNSTPIGTLNSYTLSDALDTKTISGTGWISFDITGDASKGFKKALADGASQLSVCLKAGGSRPTPTYASGGYALGLYDVDEAVFSDETAYIRVEIAEGVPSSPTDTTGEQSGTREIPRESFRAGGSFGF